MAHEGKASGAWPLAARRQPRAPPAEPNALVLDHLGAPWPTSGIGAPGSQALAARGSAPLAAVVRSDGRAVSLVTCDALLNRKGDPV